MTNKNNWKNGGHANGQIATDKCAKAAMKYLLEQSSIY